MFDKAVEILLVEDNPNDVELTLLAFEESRLVNSIQVARDGVEALDYIFCTGAFTGRNILDRPKLILLDLKLPRVDGLEVLQQVKADPRTRSIPVVVLTTSREEPDIMKSYQLGANSYIVKPVDFNQFSEVAHKLGFYWLLINQSPFS